MHRLHYIYVHCARIIREVKRKYTRLTKKSDQQWHAGRMYCLACKLPPIIVEQEPHEKKKTTNNPKDGNSVKEKKMNAQATNKRKPRRFKRSKHSQTHNPIQK